MNYESVSKQFTAERYPGNVATSVQTARRVGVLRLQSFVFHSDSRIYSAYSF